MSGQYWHKLYRAFCPQNKGPGLKSTRANYYFFVNKEKKLLKQASFYILGKNIFVNKPSFDTSFWTDNLCTLAAIFTFTVTVNIKWKIHHLFRG